MMTLTEAEYRAHCNDYDGLCLSCGEFTDGGVEPDAEGYYCSACGEDTVIGTEQALIMGRLEVEDVED